MSGTDLNVSFDLNLIMLPQDNSYYHSCFTEEIEFQERKFLPKITEPVNGKIRIEPKSFSKPKYLTMMYQKLRLKAITTCKSLDYSRVWLFFLDSLLLFCISTNFLKWKLAGLKKVLNTLLNRARECWYYLGVLWLTFKYAFQPPDITSYL